MGNTGEHVRSEGFGATAPDDDLAALAELRQEAAALRERLETAPAAQSASRVGRDVRQLEAHIETLTSRNAKLMETLKDARQQLLALR